MLSMKSRRRRRRMVPVALGDNVRARIRSSSPRPRPLPTPAHSSFSHIHIVPRVSPDQDAAEDAGDEGDGGPVFTSQSYQIHAAAALNGLSNLNHNNAAVLANNNNNGSSFADKARAAELASQAERCAHLLNEGEEPPSSAPVALSGYIKFKRSKAGRSSKYSDFSDMEASASASTADSSHPNLGPDKDSNMGEIRDKTSRRSARKVVNTNDSHAKVTAIQDLCAGSQPEINHAPFPAQTQLIEQVQAAAPPSTYEAEIFAIFGTKLPTPDILRVVPGSDHGQVGFVQEFNGDISAHQWSALTNQWSELGRFSYLHKRIEGKLVAHLSNSPLRHSPKRKQNTLAFFAALAKEREADAMLPDSQATIAHLRDMSLADEEKTPPARPRAAVINHDNAGAFEPFQPRNPFEAVPLPSPLRKGSSAATIAQQTRSKALSQGLMTPQQYQSSSGSDIDPFITPRPRHAAPVNQSRINAGNFRSGHEPGPWELGPDTPVRTPLGEFGPIGTQPPGHGVVGANRGLNAQGERIAGRNFPAVNRLGNDLRLQAMSNDSAFKSGGIRADLRNIEFGQMGPAHKQLAQEVFDNERDWRKPVRNYPQATGPSNTAGAARTVLHDPLAPPRKKPTNRWEAKGFPADRPESFSETATIRGLPTPVNRRYGAAALPSYPPEAAPFSRAPGTPLRPVINAEYSPKSWPGEPLNRIQNAIGGASAGGQRLPVRQNLDEHLPSTAVNPLTGTPYSAFAPHVPDIGALEEWWESGSRTDRQTDFFNTLQRPGQPGAPHKETNPAANRLLVGLYDTLAGYVEKPRGNRYDHLGPFGEPPEWSIDMGSGGANSYFGEDHGSLPPRVGRDPRFSGNTARGGHSSPYREHERQNRTPKR